MKRSSRPPLLPQPRTRAEWLFDLVAHAALIYGILAVALSWSQLPDQIPTHFGADGEADGFGSKHILWALLGMATILWGALWALARIPHLHNYPIKVTDKNAQQLYAVSREMLFAVRAAVVALLAVLVGGSVDIALGNEDRLGIASIVLTAVLMGLVAIYFVRMLRCRAPADHGG